MHDTTDEPLTSVLGKIYNHKTITEATSSFKPQQIWQQ